MVLTMTLQFNLSESVLECKSAGERVCHASQCVNISDSKNKDISAIIFKEKHG